MKKALSSIDQKSFLSDRKVIRMSIRLDKKWAQDVDATAR